MKTRLVISLLLVLSVLSSCSTLTYTSMERDYTKEYVGKAESYITSILGQPSHKLSDGNEGTVYIYSDPKSFAKASGYSFATKDTKGAYESDPVVKFFVGSDGLCYSVSTNHMKVDKSFSESKTWALMGGIGGTIALALTACYIFL